MTNRAKRLIKVASDVLGGYLTPIRGYVKMKFSKSKYIEHQGAETPTDIIAELARNIPFGQEVWRPETQVLTRAEALVEFNHFSGN